MILFNELALASIYFDFKMRSLLGIIILRYYTCKSESELEKEGNAATISACRVSGRLAKIEFTIIKKKVKECA